MEWFRSTRGWVIIAIVALAGLLLVQNGGARSSRSLTVSEQKAIENQALLGPLNDLNSFMVALEDGGYTPLKLDGKTVLFGKCASQECASATPSIHSPEIYASAIFSSSTKQVIGVGQAVRYVARIQKDSGDTTASCTPPSSFVLTKDTLRLLQRVFVAYTGNSKGDHAVWSNFRGGKGPYGVPQWDEWTCSSK